MTSTTAYPTNIYFPSCVISGGYITCVAGLTAVGTLGNAVYYASVSSSGIGSWTSTTAFPTAIEVTSCVVSSGYITCVGGLTYVGSPESNTNAVYYDTIASGAVGATWTSTTNYPTNIQATSCVVSGGYITCVGGEYDPAHSYTTTAVYYDTISSGAVGASWTSTTAYPGNVSFEPCVLNSGYIYCVGGYGGVETAVYYDSISSGAVGASWSSGTSYPDSVQSAQCAISGGYMYCVGGETSDVYYTTVGGSSTTTTTSSTTTSTTTTSTTTTFAARHRQSS